MLRTGNIKSPVWFEPGHKFYAWLPLQIVPRGVV